jgi:hypothetical protein
MRKLDLAQRRESMRNKKDPVLDHCLDKKIDYSFPKLRVEAAGKKRSQIDYTSEFETK